MNIELKEISVKELVEGFKDNQEDGVVGYSGNLDIRPPYQREFVYNDKQRDAVINTIVNDFPLNVMYWAKREDGGFEIIDGQQRTISICQYVAEQFSFSKNGLYFQNLQDDQQKQILDYKLMVYVCSGDNSEKLDWFRTINIAGEKLTDQELRNAVYHGSWVSSAKRYFSKSGCPAHGLGSKYLKGSSIRQEYLETAIKWISKDSIIDYMGKHQHDNSAVELWNYFQSVISWVEANFKVYRKEMKGIDWGYLYNDFKNEDLNPDKIEEITKELMSDDEVTKRKGIYEYILRKDEKFLNLRTFTDNEKRMMYERQDGQCNIRKKPYPIEEMHADHITPWSEGGKTNIDNGQMIHKDENRRKSNT
jgi:hypothetical protein